MLKGSFQEFSFSCSSVEEVPAAVGETKLLDIGADTRPELSNCITDHVKDNSLIAAAVI